MLCPLFLSLPCGRGWKNAGESFRYHSRWGEGGWGRGVPLGAVWLILSPLERIGNAPATQLPESCCRDVRRAGKFELSAHWTDLTSGSGGVVFGVLPPGVMVVGNFSVESVELFGIQAIPRRDVGICALVLLVCIRRCRNRLTPRSRRISARGLGVVACLVFLWVFLRGRGVTSNWGRSGR